MKTLANRLVLIAAGALTLGSAAYGQTAMVAKIPFAFHTSNATMPAGEYFVAEETNTGAVVVRMRNETTKQNVMMAGGPLDWYSKGQPRITFRCVGGACYLSQIRNASGSVSYPAPRKPGSHQVATVISIPLTGAAGE